MASLSRMESQRPCWRTANLGTYIHHQPSLLVCIWEYSRKRVLGRVHSLRTTQFIPNIPRQTVLITRIPAQFPEHGASQPLAGQVIALVHHGVDIVETHDDFLIGIIAVRRTSLTVISDRRAGLREDLVVPDASLPAPGANARVTLADTGCLI